MRALRGVDLEVQRGEIFGFHGPNGAGKMPAWMTMDWWLSIDRKQK